MDDDWHGWQKLAEIDDYELYQIKTDCKEYEYMVLYKGTRILSLHKKRTEYSGNGCVTYIISDYRKRNEITYYDYTGALWHFEQLLLEYGANFLTAYLYDYELHG